MIKVIALFGEAGAGKDYILKIAMECFPHYNKIVSCTTRPKRDYEEEGIDYFFLTDEQFQEKIKNGDMLEYTEFNGWYYGTMIQALDPDKVNIGVFNPEGVNSLVMSDKIEVRPYWVIREPKDRLLGQLTREENPNVGETVRRYNTDKEDFSNIKFNYEKINNKSGSLLQHCLKLAIRSQLDWYQCDLRHNDRTE